MSTTLLPPADQCESRFAPRTALLLLGISTFLSALLLFQVQPIAAKVLLPSFGGSAGVWSTCLVFFQSTLFLGYLYAHLVTVGMSLRRQLAVHIIVIVGAALMALTVPHYPWETGTADSEVLSILYRLSIGVGVPYFLLATTGPLLQAWYAQTDPRGVPYRLYAVSNLASLIGLMCYPFLLEPLLTLRTQLVVWRAGFWLLAAVLAGSIVVLYLSSPAAASTRAPGDATTGPRPSVKRRLIWLALPACSSAMLLAVTAQITQDIAPIPLFWIVPLAIFLGSFAICFERADWYDADLFRLLLVAALCFSSFFVLVPVGIPSVAISLLLVLAGLAVVCMFCHGELYALRPASRFLTEFYLYVALGGAAGGLFVGMIAPVVFSKYSELPLFVFLCAACALAITWHQGCKTFRLWQVLVVVFGLLGVFNIVAADQGALISARNFYGVLKIFDVNAHSAGGVRALFHGKINHGTQFLDADKMRRPTACYGPNSGVGLVFKSRGDQPWRVGILGLGAGVLAAYNGPGDLFHFYEINPLIVRFARDYFTYLEQAPGEIEVTTDDARLALEREPAQGYDLLVADAFSGDAIPLHLMTQEAFEQYERHLKPEGILAVNISNRYLDLSPVVARLASGLGRTCVIVEGDREPDAHLEASTWAILLNDRERIEYLLQVPSAHIVTETEGDLWTDDYVNLLSVIR